MDRAKGSLLQRSLIASWIAVVALGLGGCVWDGGHHNRNSGGWWGWDDDDNGHRHRNDRNWDQDNDHRDGYYRRGGVGRQPN